MDTILFPIGDHSVTVVQAILAGAGASVVILLLVLISLWRASAARARAEAETQRLAAEMQSRVADLVKTQTEMTGRMQTMAEVFGTRHSDLVGGLTDRLDKMSARMGHSMVETTQRTQESLQKVHERLAVIDQAQTHIQSLSGQVIQLQQILSNKQTRGAFGQGRMEAILQDGLPAGAYTFQPTLSNGKRPDCLVHLPNDTGGLVIDAKFPLEAWSAMRDAPDEARLKAAQQRFRADVMKHVNDIRERYFITGETQDTAFMFVPSESIFADIHEQFDDVIQRAHRARIVIVSPSLLMLSIQVVQAVLKDATMREQAHTIQIEVAHLMDDLGRLDERVRKLHTHFGQAVKDVDQVLISNDKLQKRGARIDGLDFTAPAETGELPLGARLAGE